MTNNKPVKVSIVIPNYNGRELMQKNLPSVLKATLNPKNFIEEVIVVDDGSKDDSVSFLKKEFPQIRLVIHKVNRGFSAAVNSGVKAAGSEFVVLLNSDVYPKEDFLEEVLSFIKKDEDIFAVSFHEKGWGGAKGAFEDGFIVHKPGKEGALPHSTFYVNAGGAIYRKNMWEALGGMDEKLFSPFYWEDVDISYGALKRGFKLFWHPAAYVSPNLSASVGKLPKMRVSRIQERNHLIFNWKNLTSPRLFRKHLISLFAKVFKHPKYIIIVIMALSRLRETLKARKKEIREAKVSDEIIFSRFK